jgi:Activator of Hsp90 ATPase homolog 1-like protein
VTEEPGRVVRIERTFDAPVEEVFDAWTSPEVVRRWSAQIQAAVAMRVHSRINNAGLALTMISVIVRRSSRGSRSICSARGA